MGKLVTIDEFAAERAGRRTVFTNGCFDILHAGHIAYLTRARQLGECLVIGLNTDASVRRLKGATRPVNRAADRALVLTALACVDYVILFAEDTPADIIPRVAPDILVKGGDWTVDTIVGADWVMAHGGAVEVIPYREGYSTTGVLDRTAREDVVAVIPARFGSQRFPGKPLAEIAGHPMIEWVYRQAEQVPGVTAVVVATDDERIRSAVVTFGGTAVMTGACASGSDRVAVAAAGRPEDVIVDIQGDEPLLSAMMIAPAVAVVLANPMVAVATLAVPLAPSAAAEPDAVKVVTDGNGDALYFSRAPIPYPREPQATAPRYLQHLGVYVYRRRALCRWTAMPPAELEEQEKLEQLRWLSMGGKIRVVTVSGSSVGVDRPEDIARIEQRLAEHPEENIFLRAEP